MTESKERLKAHLERHKTKYLFGIEVILSAGITCLITRGVTSQRISRGNVAVATGRGNVAVTADRSVVTSNISLISSRRQGAPSWVIRCIETNEVFSSQREAANKLDIPASIISKQLNGHRDTANGRTFERICMAA